MLERDWIRKNQTQFRGERQSKRKETRGDVCARRRHIAQPPRRMFFVAHPILAQVTLNAEISAVWWLFASKRAKNTFELWIWNTNKHTNIYVYLSHTTDNDKEQYTFQKENESRKLNTYHVKRLFIIISSHSHESLSAKQFLTPIFFYSWWPYIKNRQLFVFV